MARVLLGVSGGIAAYKAIEIVRLATAAGHSVRVVQTPTSLRFVGKASFEAVTGAPVLAEELERDPAHGAFPGDPAPDHDPISHLELVRRADVYVIAPASANTIAKLATGLADNVLTSAALASSVPLVIAPAMNAKMWGHPATQANVETLRLRGAVIVAPASGRLASRGEWGAGRLADPAEVLAAAERSLAVGGGGADFTPRSLDGLRVLVTAGGTQEPIDSVRFVGNRSSGRMGFALGAEAVRRGAEVTLIAANVTLPKPDGVRLVEVATAAELESAARAEHPDTDVLLMAAAVADFRPLAATGAKIKKEGREGLTLSFEPTADILQALSKLRRPGQTLVGFAAEHGESGSEQARAKLARKGLDAIVVNDISRADIGFDAPDNEVVIVTGAGERAVPRRPKSAIAAAVIDEVEALRARAGEQARAKVGGP